MFTKSLLLALAFLSHATLAHADTPEPAKPADPPAEAAEPPADDPEPPATEKAPGGGPNGAPNAGKIGRRLQAWCDVKHLSKADCRKVRDKLREKRQAKAGKAQPKP
jgi:hypothetical protein